MRRNATAATMMIAIAALPMPFPEELLEGIEAIDGSSNVDVGIAVTEVEVIETNDVAVVALPEVMLLFDDVVEELEEPEELDVFKEELELELAVEDVGSFMRTQIWPTTFTVAIEN